MYCATCGTLITTKLNYCNRCGARIDSLAAIDDPTGIQHLSMATGFVGLGGLGILVGLIAVLLNKDVEPKIVMTIVIFYLVALFAITYLLIRQLARLIGDNPARKTPGEAAKTFDELPAPTTAQLNEHLEPTPSVTEHTTKTLVEVPLKKS